MSYVRKAITAIQAAESELRSARVWDDVEDESLQMLINVSVGLEVFESVLHHIERRHLREQTKETNPKS